ncbi:OmpA family protein [Leptospira sp. 85282-16]|uniref:OmpA family protein n=1 Tax=Leptospira sp. 85282-16 TaxID=2971256 RepID=UPI0021BEAF54|nr:OmpA family protein [Leptospira sp. 85282-16]MCT8335242.1 OmpA family protein [Leptospira sp. 85282-16]
MARILIIILLFFGNGLTSSQSVKNGIQVLEGDLLNTGHLLRTDKQVFRISSGVLQEELAYLAGKKIRMLCDVQAETCNPIRYEMEPFESGKTPDWTLKKIPRYVTGGLFSFNPQCTPDGKILFWTALVREGGRSTQKIWAAKRDQYGFWMQGEQLPTPLNNKFPSAVISALPGGNELFVFGNFGEEEMLDNLKREMMYKSQIASREAQNPKEFHLVLTKLESEFKERTEKIQNRAPLYKTHKTESGWSMPTPINFPSFYNWYRKADNPNQQVFGGSALATSGRTLLYSAQQKKNFGKLDLYVSLQNESGVFEEGINLGNTLNTVEEEMAPFLAPDDKTLYFSSSGRKEGISIFITRRLNDSWTAWSEPQELSSNLRGVNFFSIPAVGNWAYVSREGELYMAAIPNHFQPDPVVVIKGKVVDEEGKPLSAFVQYESLTRKKSIGSTVSDPNTGEFSIILPYEENYGFYGEKEGYLPVSQNLNLVGKEKEDKEKTVLLVLPKLKKGNQIVMNNLFFAFRSAELTKESEPELDRLAGILRKSANLKILIEGHTDNVGTKTANQKLSLERANSVANYLKSKHKIEETRIAVVGFGPSTPIADNQTEEGRGTNRRVVFKISEE